MGKTITLKVSEDEMSILAHGRTTEALMQSTMAEVEEQLKLLRIKLQPDPEKWSSRIRENWNEDGEFEGVIIGQGTQVEEPRPARIDWARPFFTGGFAIDEKTGRVDYRRRTDQATVNEGDYLGEFVPQYDGQPGMTVYGKPIPIDRPKRLKVKAGLNTREEPGEQPGTRRFYATRRGRVRYTNGVLAVDDVWTIDGNVSLATGHIKHPGTVIVRGDVMAGYHIEAEGDVEVEGTVEATQIKCGGNLTVKGGISGGRGARIDAGGSVLATFINDFEVHAGADIVVEHEIVQSRVFSKGATGLPGGRIIGGHVMALAGLSVGTVGTENGTRTMISVAVHEPMTEEIRELHRQRRALEANKHKIQKAVDDARRQQDKLKARQREAMTELLARMSEMDTEIRELEEQAEATQQEYFDRAKPQILVRGIVHPESVVRVRETARRIGETLHGPMRVTINKGNLRFMRWDV